VAILSTAELYRCERSMLPRQTSAMRPKRG
jgi:hypothetical protein